MPTVKDICTVTKVTRPTIRKIALELDDGTGISTGNRSMMILTYDLTRKIFDRLVEKGLMDAGDVDACHKNLQALDRGETIGQEEATATDAAPSQSPEREEATAFEMDALLEAYDLLRASEIARAKAETEAMYTKKVIQEKDDLIETLMDQIRDLKLEVLKLSDKVEAEQARYNALSDEYFKSTKESQESVLALVNSKKKPGFFQRLLGRPSE